MTLWKSQPLNAGEMIELEKKNHHFAIPNEK